MKCICEKDELQKAVSVVSRLVSTRATLPILQTIYIQGEGETLLLRATDLEQTVEVRINAEILEGGALAIPAKLFVDYLQNTSDNTLTITGDDTKLTLESANHQAKLKTLPVEEYPTPPKFSESLSVTLDASVLKDAISRCSFASAQDDTRPILTGLLFRFQEKQLTVVATDGYRLAYQKISLQKEVDGDYIIPRKTLNELQRSIEGGQIEMLFGGTQVRFVINQSTILTSRLLDGGFPNYEAIIPKKREVVVSLSAQALLQSLRLASIFSRDSAYSTKLELKAGVLKVTAVSIQLGENTNEVAVKESEKEFTLSVNAQYLIDALQGISGDIELIYTGVDSPLVINLPKDSNYLYLVMPLRSE